VLSIAAATTLCHADEAQCLSLANRRRHGMIVDAIVDEVLFGHRQLAVIVAAMMRQFDLDPGDDAMGR
jgi:hypothetical protein